MAKYRQIHTHIWKDNWFIELEPDAKLFFIYLFSNERASISGIYELSKRVMAFESGLSIDRINTLFSEFARVGKAYFDGGVVWVPNLRKYHETRSPKVQTAILSDVEAIKDCELKGIYCEKYGIDTVSIPRYSYSSSNSSSLGTHETHATNDAIQPLITALAKHSKETYWTKTEATFEDAALTLFGWDATPEKLSELVELWEKHGFYPGKPALKTIVNVYRQWLDADWPEKPKATGDKQAQLTALVAAVKKHGQRSPLEAKAQLDGLWPVVEAMGGWHTVCGMREQDIKFKFYEALKVSV